MDLSYPQLGDSQSQRYDILTEHANPPNDEIRNFRKNTDRLSCKNATNIFHRKRNKIMYGSPLWRRDSTNRLQRKPIRKSISFESALNEIDGPEPFIIYDHSSAFDSTRINTPCLHRVEYSRFQHLRNDLMPVPTHSFFNSTMLFNNTGNGETERNANLNTLYRRGTEISKINYERNHSEKLKISELTQKNNSKNRTRKLKIFNSWIDWTPFWVRENDSKRLDRRHYISDFD